MTPTYETTYGQWLSLLTFKNCESEVWAEEWEGEPSNAHTCIMWVPLGWMMLVQTHLPLRQFQQAPFPCLSFIPDHDHLMRWKILDDEEPILIKIIA